MSWPFETSDAYVVPERVSEMQRVRSGLTPEEWRLPPTLVATFQREAYARLLERVSTRAEPPGNVQLGPSLESAMGVVDGTPVTIARIGIGAPAAAIVLEMSIARGVRNILVVGSAGSLQPHLALGSTVVVEGAEREDGTSHHYLPAGEVVAADVGLSAALADSATARGATPVRGRSWTIDAPYRETVGAIRRHREAGVSVVEMEAAAMFAVARVRGVRAGLIVAVSDELFGHEWNPGFQHASYLDALLIAADAVMDTAVRLRG